MEHEHCWEILVDGKNNDKSGFVQCVIKGCDDVRYLDEDGMSRFKELRSHAGCGHEITLVERGEEGKDFWPESLPD